MFSPQASDLSMHLRKVTSSILCATSETPATGQRVMPYLRLSHNTMHCCRYSSTSYLITIVFSLSGVGTHTHTTSGYCVTANNL